MKKLFIICLSVCSILLFSSCERKLILKEYKDKVQFVYIDSKGNICDSACSPQFGTMNEALETIQPIVNNFLKNDNKDSINLSFKVLRNNNGDTEKFIYQYSGKNNECAIYIDDSDYKLVIKRKE